MTLVEFKRILDEAGYPVTYSHFNTPPSLPYIIYLSAYSSHFVADNKVTHKIDNLQVELYTAKKDLTAESKLETVLDNHEIPYDSTESYIASEGLFQKLYEVSLI
jgi:hypothetical protein